MIIYEIKNKVTGEPYIGYSTRFNSNEEFQKSKYWGSGSYLKNAIKKYGKENFNRKVLLRNIFNFQELKQYEILWIHKKNSKRPNGYNLTDGGDGTLGSHWQLTPKTKQKMSEIHKGEKNPMWGKGYLRKGEKHHNAVRVTFISPKGQKFFLISYQQFSKDNELDPGTMVKVLQGKRKQHKGWMGYYGHS